jgi:hypothetical protein
MINNAGIWEVFAPGMEHPTEADFGDTFTALNVLPIHWMDRVDISNGSCISRPTSLGPSPA